MFVTVEATLLYDHGAFTGIRHQWTFDEYDTEMAIEGLDKNHDGKYDRAELSELAKVNIDSLKGFAYFTFPTLAGQPVKVGEPRGDYYLEYKDRALSLYFTLPFATPVLTGAKDFKVQVSDPSIFIAFQPAKGEQAVGFSPGTPKSCRVTVGDPEDPSAEAPKNALTQFGGVMSPAVTLSVACSGP
ncbi:MAG: DUF1007 family protein [Hyphomicrobiaceae bacterium]|nr:DUF1007 family protein [Hyphomicrobiaceae bacterium]